LQSWGAARARGPRFAYLRSESPWNGECSGAAAKRQSAQEGVAVAKQLVEEGVQLLELCGGFGPRWTAAMLDATGRRVPAGAVAYGPESIDAMHALFAK
jgi:hypothetical protein